jgi:3-oxoadipate enol-lactonase
MNQDFETQIICTPNVDLAIHTLGDPSGPAVLMAHSILSSSMMWVEQAHLLAACGFRVICADTRGHGASSAPLGPYTMQELVNDHISILDGLDIERAHYIGLSLGSMSGFGLGAQFGLRLLSLLLCDGRADMPAAAGQPWDERIELAQKEGTQALAVPTTLRWFGEAFTQAHPEVQNAFCDTIANTSVQGFCGCARAIQGLDFLSQAHTISVPTTLLVGANDGPLPEANKALQGLIPGAKLEVIANSGHLPNIDNPSAFNAALMRHFFQNPLWSQS